MASCMHPSLWPLAGLISFLTRPSLWKGPLLAMFAGGVLLVAVVAGEMYRAWPTPDLSWWRWWLTCLLAFGWAGAAAVVTWVVASPFLIGFALDGVVRAEQRAAGAPDVPGETILPAFASALRVFLRTLPMRALWTVIALVAAFLGPVGMVVAAAAIAHLAVLDCLDAALAARGLNGAARLAAIRAHHHEVFAGVATAAMLNLGLGATLILWPAWLPGIGAGAARLVLQWPECRGIAVVSPGGGLPSP